MAECGTPAGYQAHRKRNEDACPDCRKARADYSTQIRDRYPSHRVKQYTRQAARYRALVRLSKVHPGDYELLLADELRKAGEPNG